MELRTCEKCHLKGVEKIVQRQGEEIPYESCWRGSGQPPFYAMNIKDEKDKVDHSFRFSSSPSILAVSNKSTAPDTDQTATTVSQSQKKIGPGLVVCLLSPMKTSRNLLLLPLALFSQLNESTVTTSHN